DTLPTAPVKHIALMRLDGDMYGSTMDALSSLYPKLSSGGFCIIDDYALPGCRQAVDEYRAQNGISSEMVKIDHSAVFWRQH
ncbi:MAG: TylF/MycF/NovP-related O-methyltransferase, partial [Burkholderiales bacterium]